MDKLGKEIKKLNGKLSNEGFLKKAPAQVVEGERTKLAGYEEKMKSLEARLADLRKL
jgi:valyl-tRNA synthetase